MSDCSVESLPREFIHVLDRDTHGRSLRNRGREPDYNEDASESEPLLMDGDQSDESVSLGNDDQIADAVKGIRFPLYYRDEYILAQKNVKAYKARTIRECNAQLKYIKNALDEIDQEG